MGDKPLNADVLCRNLRDICSRYLFCEDGEHYRGMVFVETVPEAKRLYAHLLQHAKDFVFPFIYHRDRDREKRELADNRNDMEESFRMFCNTSAATPYVCISTTCGGTGINVPRCRVSITWKSTYSMLDFVQQSGRAGRNLQVTSVTRVITDNYSIQNVMKRRSQCLVDKNGLDEGEDKSLYHSLMYDDFTWMLRFWENDITNKECMRKLIGDYSFGKGKGPRCCELPDAVPCQVCEHFINLLPDGGFMCSEVKLGSNYDKKKDNVPCYNTS